MCVCVLWVDIFVTHTPSLHVLLWPPAACKQRKKQDTPGLYRQLRFVPYTVILMGQDCVWLCVCVCVCVCVCEHKAVRTHCLVIVSPSTLLHSSSPFIVCLPIISVCPPPYTSTSVLSFKEIIHCVCVCVLSIKMSPFSLTHYSTCLVQSLSVFHCSISVHM